MKIDRIESSEFPGDWLEVSAFHEVSGDVHIIASTVADSAGNGRVETHIVLTAKEAQRVRRVLKRPKHIDDLYIDQDEHDRIATVKGTA